MSFWVENVVKRLRSTDTQAAVHPEAVADSVRQFMENGYRYIRIQMGGYGGEASRIVKPEGAPDGAYFDPREYMLNMRADDRACPI